MVGPDMMTSLDLTRSEIKKVFHHSAYDGVYVTSEELTHARGCFSLLKHLTDWCDVEWGEITGLMDIGHNQDAVSKFDRVLQITEVTVNYVIASEMSIPSFQMKKKRE